LNNNENINLEISTTQKYLKNKGLVALLGLLSAFVPLSTDIYLPALPKMTKYFQVHQSLINLTLIVFFIFFGVGTLFWGPLSDKYGRKPILLTGLITYSIACILCATSVNVYVLIISRALQAFGGSAATATATAIVKDVYSGRKRESVLALVQSMVVISPAVAPVFGAFLMKITSWRGIFVSQTAIGVIGFICALMFQETNINKSLRSVIKTIGRLGSVLKNQNFTFLLIIFSMNSIAFMAFISASSYIYQNTFNLSSEVYSYYFTFNAMAMLLGPYIYIRLIAHFKRNIIINICYVVMIISGLMILIFGSYRPWLFATILFPCTIAGSAMRPPSTFLMLEQQKSDTGSASSLMSFSASMMGCIGMMVVSFVGSALTAVVGGLYFILGIICGCLWFQISKKPHLKRINDNI